MVARVAPQYYRAMNDFRISGLDPQPFLDLYGRSEAELAARGARRFIVDAKPGFPDRVEMRDLDLGETALLVSYEHLSGPSPYRSRHAVFVREGATRAYDAVNEVPEVLRSRLLSVRAFDVADMMVDADVVQGSDLARLLRSLFANRDIAYIHVHNAKPGCYAARVDRA